MAPIATNWGVATMASNPTLGPITRNARRVVATLRARGMAFEANFVESLNKKRAASKCLNAVLHRENLELRRRVEEG